MANPHPPAPAADPGNAPPAAWAVAFSDAELAALLGVLDDPTDPLVVAGLAGTLYDDPALNRPSESGGDGDGH